MSIDEQEDKISLIDLLLVVAQNIKLLIFAPLVIGLLAFGITASLPNTFTSHADLTLGESAKAVESIMRSPVVLDVLLNQFPSSLGLTDASREEITKRFRFSTISASQKSSSVLTRLEVDGRDPEQARALANALIDAWLATTKPQPENKHELERKLKLDREALVTVSNLIARLEGETTKLIMPNMQFDLATPAVQLLKLRNGYVDEIAAIGLQLRGTTHDVVLSPPTLPTQQVKNKTDLIPILVGMGSGFALLLWVFMRKAWENAAQDPMAFEKQGRLKAALDFRRVKT
jgi:hypothetical protein